MTQTPYPNTRAIPEIRQFDLSEINSGVLPHIAFCFITTTPILNQNAWLAYFESARAAGLRFTIIYHAGKNNKLFDTEIGAIKCDYAPNSWHDTTYVHVNLIRAAKSVGADKAVILSETCLPLKPPIKLFESCKHPFTIVTNASIKTKSSQHNLPAVGWDRWVKHEQWGVIDKRDFDAYEVTKANKFLFDHLQRVRFGNEFQTHALTRYRDGAANVRSSNFWFVSWGRSDAHPMLMTDSIAYLDKHNLQVARHPLRNNMSQITAVDFANLYENKPHLFGRKFHQSVVNEAYLSYISGKESTTQIDVIQI